MSNIQSPFEFDQSNELHRKAQHYLETMDREVFPTFGDVMVAAIVDYFDRYYEKEMDRINVSDDSINGLGTGSDDSIGGLGTGSDDLDLRIERAVERALENKLPGIIEEALRNNNVTAPADDSQEGEEEPSQDDSVDLSSVADDISWGFLQG